MKLFKTTGTTGSKTTTMLTLGAALVLGLGYAMTPTSAAADGACAGSGFFITADYVTDGSTLLPPTIEGEMAAGYGADVDTDGLIKVHNNYITASVQIDGDVGEGQLFEDDGAISLADADMDGVFRPGEPTAPLFVTAEFEADTRLMRSYGAYSVADLIVDDKTDAFGSLTSDAVILADATTGIFLNETTASGAATLS